MGVRVADLPDVTDIDPESYLIIEKPGVGEGTFKGTVGDLQRATTVTASVSEVDHVVHIEVTDINGTTEATIVKPTAQIIDNHNGTSTIILTDESGETSQTIVNDVIMDPTPTEDSPNLVSSGTLYTELTGIKSRLTSVETDVAKVFELLMWEGTRAQWESLSSEEKSQYKIVCISDE